MSGAAMLCAAFHRLGRLDNATLTGREDKVLWFRRAKLISSILQLCQSEHGSFVQWNDPVSDIRLRTVSLNGQCGIKEVHVFPAKTLQFAASHSGIQRQHRSTSGNVPIRLCSGSDWGYQWEGFIWVGFHWGFVHSQASKHDAKHNHPYGVQWA